MDDRPVDKFHLHRWLTAAIALPLVVLIIGLGPGWLVLVLVLSVVAGGMLELFGFLLAGSKAWLRLATLILGLMLPLAAYWRGPAGLTAATTAMFFIALAVHMLLYAKKEADIVNSLGAMVISLIYVPFALSHLLLLFQLPAGRRWIFFVLLVIFAGDTGAYYAGYRWGRRKLFPAISPGKTVAGAGGGLLSSLALAFLTGKILLSSTGVDLRFFLALGFALAIVGQLGDLMESMLKRLAQVKDASGLLPGHGGLLDRLDSLLFAFPVAYYAVLFFA